MMFFRGREMSLLVCIFAYMYMYVDCREHAPWLAPIGSCSFHGSTLEPLQKSSPEDVVFLLCDSSALATGAVNPRENQQETTMSS